MAGKGDGDELARPIFVLSKRRASRPPNRSAAAAEAKPLMDIRRQESKTSRRSARAGLLDGDGHGTRAAHCDAYRFCIVGCAR
jgi:hypothetical protein